VAELIPAAEAAVLNYEEALRTMADFKKKYTSVKNKAKRIEKYLATLDEADSNLYGYSMVNNVRLAENKFILIDKKLNRFKGDERFCRKSLKLLKGIEVMERSTTVWHIQHLSAHLGNVNSLVREVADMLRIANGHLTKVYDHKKFIARIRKRGRLY